MEKDTAGWGARKIPSVSNQYECPKFLKIDPEPRNTQKQAIIQSANNDEGFCNFFMFGREISW